MYVYAVTRYLVPLERINQTVDRHRAYLRELKDRRKLVAAGPLSPRTGGALLLRVRDAAELRAVLAGDPFDQEKLVEWTTFVWEPVIGADRLDTL